MNENSQFTTGDETSNDGPMFSAYTFSKNDRKLKDQQSDRQIEPQTSRQSGRKLTDRQEVGGNELPPPDDNDLLQLESKLLNSTNFDFETSNPDGQADYEEYFDYLYKDGKKFKIKIQFLSGYEDKVLFEIVLICSNKCKEK